MMSSGRHTSLPFAILLATSLVAALPITGCVFRDEVVTVAKDGSVTIELEIEGSEEELKTGDAMPSEESGWQVRRTIKKEDDKEKRVLTTRREFAPGERLPQTFASDDDPDADLYLHFPTTIRIERRTDGTYYYFRRVYPPRRWAYVEHWRDMFFDDNIDKISKKPVEALTRDDRLQIVQAFAGFEAFKRLEFAKTALANSQPDLPVEYGLMARRAALNVYEKDNDYFNNILDRCENLAAEERDACFNDEAERILAGGYNAYLESLRTDAGLGGGQIAQFEEAFRRAKRYYELTDQLGGQGFEVRVKMPGTIIAHNAEKYRKGDTGEPESVKFQFEGKWFYDRPVELLVVSRLARPADDR